MQVPTYLILIYLAVSATLSGLGAAVVRRAARSSAPDLNTRRAQGYLLVLLGLGLAAVLAALQLTGRLGLAQLWFRAPTFYVAAALLLAGAFWWYRHSIPHPRARLIRHGLPALVLILISLALIALRFDGHSTPIAALLPTLRTEAPDLSFHDDAGELRKLSDYRGKVVLLNFWATWCVPCRREMPMLAKLQRANAQRGFVVLYLSMEEPQVLAEFLRDHRFDGVQGRLAEAPPFYDAGRFYPLSYLISRDGRVQKRWGGRPDEAWLAAAIKEQL